MKKLLIPGVAALTLLCAPTMYCQAVVRETTTTTTAAAAPLEVAGTITEWGPDRVILRERDVADPVSYSFAKRVEYVDAAGNPVAREVITRGAPVTVRYIREGDRMLVDRVIVQRTAPAAVVAPATVVAPVRVVTPAAAATTETTTTTTTTISGREAKEIDKLRAKIAHEERELAEHPDRTRLQDDLARDRAALEAIEGKR
jgi:hypothetical protein